MLRGTGVQSVFIFGTRYMPRKALHNARAYDRRVAATPTGSRGGLHSLFYTGYSTADFSLI